MAKNKQILLSSTSYIINDLLTYTFDTNLGGKIKSTGTVIADRLITKVSAKSGLTDFDSYMIGYTPLYTLGIWTGNNDYSVLTDTYSKNFPKEAFLHIINFLSKENKNIWYEKPNAVYSIFTDPTLFNTGYEKNVYFLN
jgi:membrane peptidoglycan carboxypeptidase